VNYRTLSDEELVRMADADPMMLVHPLFAELTERLRLPQRVNFGDRKQPNYQDARRRGGRDSDLPLVTDVRR
jgi:hypothetical protein